MNIAFLEGAFVIALVAVGGAFLLSVLGITPLGKRMQQTANRRRIDRDADLTCPVHGKQDEGSLVRLPTGETLCPLCYQEAVHGHVD